MNIVNGKSIKQSDKWIRRFLWLLCIGAVLVNIKCIFSDFDVDVGYASVMSYRMLKGDRMFVDMWEPHQTSAALAALFMWIYINVAGTTAGIVVFLNIIGVLLQGIIAMALYKVLSSRVEPTIAALISIFFFTFRPKGIVFPEFSNMQIGFSVLLFLCLLLYFADQSKKHYLIFASVCLCLMILSYPSCLVLYPVVLALLYIYGQRRFFSTVFFSICCFLQGMCYVLYFAVRIGFDGLFTGIRNLVEADSTHSGSMLGRPGYFSFFNQGCVWLACCLAASLLLTAIIQGVTRKRGKQRQNSFKGDLLIIFSLLVFFSEIVRSLVYRDRYTYITVFLLIILLGSFGVKLCDAMEKQIYVLGMLISAGSFLATFLLSNLDFLSIAAYLVLAVMVSLIPLGRWLDKNIASVKKVVKKSLILLFCAMIIMHRGIIIKTAGTLGISLLDLLELRGMIRSGPPLGIVSYYMGAHEPNTNGREWGQFVFPGDRLLVIGSADVNNIMYLYTDVEICIHSTISTPTYDEKLLEYWETHPDKFPNVIAVHCQDGKPLIGEESWIYQWIQKEFQPAICEEGTFWRFYRLTE